MAPMKPVPTQALDGQSRSIKYAERDVRMGFVRKAAGGSYYMIIVVL